MNWSYTKNIIITLLLILNLLLASIRIGTNKANYSLSDEVETSVRHILSVYDYQLYTFLPDNFYPMKKAKASQRQVDGQVIADHFLDKDNINKVNEGNKDIYFNEEDTYVEVYRNGKVNYYWTFDKDNEIFKDNTIDKDEAYELVSKFMIKVYKGDRIYKAISYDKENNIYKYEYYNTIRDNIILNDYIKINVYQDHLEAEMWGVNVSLTSDKKEDILPIDEILFNFVRKVSNENLEEKYITDIQIGYYALNDDVMVNGDQIEYPYYKISVKYDSDYYINAYTNEIYDKNLIKIENKID